MATLHERRFLKCPYQRARNFLNELFSNVADAGAAQTWELSVPITENGGTPIEKDVTVSISRATDAMHFDEPWAIRWTPKDGGPYPSFSGTLTIRADDDDTSCALELIGTYEPPLGIIGAAFDAIVGRHVAAVTAQHLLKDIGQRIEHAHASEERAKAVARGNLR